MKRSKSQSHEQRRAIDQKLEMMRPLGKLVPPRMGWIKAIRESLGLSSRQLAERLKISQAAITQLEAREPQKQVTLESLEKAAQGMDCKLIYALVPIQTSLDAILETRAKRAAERILRTIKHSMKLEDQAVNKDESQYQLETLSRELKEALDPRIWEET